MRRVAAVILVACKTVAPAVDAAPLSSASAPVIESPTAPATASASATAAPAASVACARDSDCVALPSPCCGSWPSNLASREAVRKAIEAADAKRCQNRVCTMRMDEAACDRGACVVR